MSHPSIIHYRPEIDGLRAVAVIPVILFHAGFELFSGGFVGVDVFFVISGYLITSIIHKEITGGRFTLRNFYARRARRILPALFLVMAACIPAAFVWLLPPDLKAFSHSLAAVAVFMSNMLFYSESGYFAADAELKPLLHTWSLAVEEQYYVLFPLFLLLAWRLGRRWLVAILAVLCVASLALAEWGTKYYPSGAFYLLPARGWEILVGALAAFYLSARPYDPGVRYRLQSPVQWLGLLGLGMILTAVFIYDGKTPFPGLYALLPTLGTILLILYAREGTLAWRLLTPRAVVFLGLISYSAYLWHHPLFAYARYGRNEEPSVAVMLGLIVTALALAALSYKFVETPFRRNGVKAVPMVLISVAFISLGAIGNKTGGYEDWWLARQSSQTQATWKLIAESRTIGIEQDDKACRFNTSSFEARDKKRILACYRQHGPALVILGDSHAIDLFGLVVSSIKERPFIVGITLGGCRPHTPKPVCRYREFRRFLQNNPGVVETVIYEQAGFHLMRTHQYKKGNRKIFSTTPLGRQLPEILVNEVYVQRVVEYLQSLTAHTRVIWFGPRTEPHISQWDILARGCDYPFALRPGQAEAFARLGDYIESALAGSDVRYVSQDRFIGYRFPEDFMSCQAGLYWHDGDHLSALGEKSFGERVDFSSLLSD